MWLIRHKAVGFLNTLDWHPNNFFMGDTIPLLPCSMYCEASPFPLEPIHSLHQWNQPYCCLLALHRDSCLFRILRQCPIGVMAGSSNQRLEWNITPCSRSRPSTAFDDTCLVSSLSNEFDKRSHHVSTAYVKHTHSDRFSTIQPNKSPHPSQKSCIFPPLQGTEKPFQAVVLTT